MTVPYAPFWSSITAVAALSGCTLLAGKDSSKDDGGKAPKKSESPVAAARVAGHWQAYAIDLLKADNKASDLYALFTEGGWSDDGQVMVLVAGESMQVVYAKPNAKDKAEPVRTATAAESSAFRASIQEATKLTDISVEAFDALTFEYVHFKKSGTNVQDVQRVFIRNPSKPMPEHDKLLKAFEMLKPQ